jgi:hypothetical protein
MGVEEGHLDHAKRLLKSLREEMDAKYRLVERGDRVID